MYYFCGRLPSSGNSGTTCAIILRSLATQLIKQNLEMASLVHEAFQEKGSFRSIRAMKTLLCDVGPNVKPMRLLLYGLDKCDTNVQESTIQSMLDLQKGAAGRCKVLILSREESSIRRKMSGKFHLPLNDKTTDSLNLFIKTNVAELREQNSHYEP